MQNQPPTAPGPGYAAILEHFALASQCRRVNVHASIFGAISLVVATPINLACAPASYLAKYGDLSDPPGSGFMPEPGLFPFIIACLSALIGLTSLIVPHFLPTTTRGLIARRVIRAVAVAGVCSVAVSIISVAHAGGS